jgi:hypothetical protein
MLRVGQETGQLPAAGHPARARIGADTPRFEACTVPELLAQGVIWRFVGAGHSRVHGCSAAVPDSHSGFRPVAAGNARRVRDVRGAVGAATRGRCAAPLGG